MRRDFSRSILTIAEALHGYAMGRPGGDRRLLDEGAGWLRSALNIWSPPKPEASVFDGLVYALCVRALVEYDACLRVHDWTVTTEEA